MTTASHDMLSSLFSDYFPCTILCLLLVGCGACAPLVAVPHVWYLEILTVALMGAFFGVALTPSLPEISQVSHITCLNLCGRGTNADGCGISCVDVICIYI